MNLTSPRLVRFVTSRRVVLLFALTFGVAHPLAAQSDTAQRGTAAGMLCSDQRCALLIVPTWNGLAVEEGGTGRRVANLHFFWPHDVTASLAGSSPGVRGADSAAAHAREAVRIRRIGAALTDAGVVLAGAAVIGALAARHFRRQDGIIGAVGGAALGVSVPFQFAADGALSRAVWWHNLRFTR